jgi:hypothetical protein
MAGIVQSKKAIDKINFNHPALDHCGLGFEFASSGWVRARQQSIIPRLMLADPAQ